MIEQALVDEEAIINAAKTHSNAFGKLYEQYQQRVFSYVLYRVADAQSADDLTAQIFERALRKIATYQPDRGAFAVWLFTIARNTEGEGQQAVVNQPLSQQEASRLAGFPVLLPTYVPADLTLTVTDVMTETNGAYVSIAYTGRGILSIMQWKLPPERQHNMRVGDATTKPVMIRGYQGYSIENAGLGAVGDDVTFQPSNDNALIWEENGILFQVISAGAEGSDFQALPIAELLKIAESLRP